jgi:flagellin-like hook-associated protein FlgL
MVLIINTNLASLNAQRHLNHSQTALQTSLTRLSSGLRINSSRDDAVGLGISVRLSTQIRGLTQSARNVQEGVSIVQIADAALGSISDYLARIRELAVAAANGINSDTERQHLNAEVRQRVAEIDRIAASTTFGDLKLLDGSAGTLQIQTGLEALQILGVDLKQSVRSNALGAMATVQSADLRARVSAPGGLVLAAGDLTVQVGSSPAVSVTGTFTSVEALASAVNAAMGGKASAAAGAAQELGQQPIGYGGDLRTSAEWSNLNSFATLKSDGSVVTWGSSTDGGDSSAVATQLSSGVQQIFSASYAFAALKQNGSVVTWGDNMNGGDSSAVSAQLSSGVRQVFSNQYGFAALKSDGSVVTWGDNMNGGDSSAVSAQLSSGVQHIFSSRSAFAALKNDGSVVTWGNSIEGGDSSAVSTQLGSGVQRIFSTRGAFAALKNDGSVVTWGDIAYGGDSAAVSAQLSSEVQQIFSTQVAFAALKNDGSVVTWGNSTRGGDSSAVTTQLSAGVQHIFSARSAFAALKNDGSVVTWGDDLEGGNSSAVSPQLSSGVQQVFSNRSAFAALKNDGSVVTWGDIAYGGDSGAVSAQLSSEVQQIFATRRAFAALKRDGSVVTWGDSIGGGDSSVVSGQLNGGVRQIIGNWNAFAALKNDGSVVTWGENWRGGDSSTVTAQLTSARSLANPFTPETPLGGGLTVNAGERIIIGGARSAMLGFAASALALGNLTSVKTTTAALAYDTMIRADLALVTLSTQRARLGATLRRFDSLTSSLTTTSTNLSAARSRITDTDYATETVALTRAQIIRKAGQAILAQANATPQLILALLRNR